MSQQSLIPTDEPPAEPLPSQDKTVPVRWGRVLALALPLIVLNGGWIANSEMKTGVTELTISTLFIGVTFILFVVTLLNLLVRKFGGPRASLNQPEMMGLYTTLSLSSVIAGVGHFGFLTPFLANPFYYDTPQNGWDGFRDALPWYIGPRNPAILRGFYEGHATALTRPILAAWAGPLVVWCIFFLVLLWTTLCLGTILRRRWADEEHLPFPVLALPLEMTREGVPLYRKRLLWMGFAIPCFFHSLNSLNSLYPTVPSMPFNILHDLIPVANLSFPWTGMDSFFYLLHPSGVGFGYLINTDVSFSLWFFYLLKKALGVWGAAEGWRQPLQGWGGDATSQFPFTGFQGYGAWLALGLTALWTGRGYYRGYLRRAWFGDRTGVDGGEILSARAAVLGFLGGFLALCIFVWSTGGSWWLPIIFLAIYILIMVALARLRAETAVLSTELGWISPQAMLPSVLGTSGMERMDLVHMGMLTWFNLDYRAAGLPHELEGMVGLKRAGGALRPLLGVLLIVVIVGMVSALLWDLQLYYVNGADTGNVNQWRVTDRGNVAWDTLAHWLHNPQPPDPHALAGALVGIAITCLLTALRARFVGFPLHPAAYVLNTSFANDFFWCDMFVAWLLKSLILRYGGMNVYRQALPFFLGLILGDFVTGAAWSIAGTVMHVSLFRTFAI
jgi:hypothetical protein